MVEHLEKKIVVVMVVLVAIILVGATLVYRQKSIVDHSTPTEASLQQLYDGQTVAQDQKDASSAIAVAPTSESKPADAGFKKTTITEIKWEDLYKLDYKTGKAPDSLKKLHKTKVRIPGFIVPLSDDLRALKEFLLVPNAQACIHVPAPPPNLIVYVILDKSLPIEKVTNPSWIEGTLLIETSNSEYGAASYKMLADKMEEYKF